MVQQLNGKKIILGVTGSISAYKAPIIVRELIRRGMQVRVVMTESANKFVTKLALQNVSKNDVITDMFDENLQENGSWHIHLAQWSDCMVIAPCSANSLARIAHGFADNALSSLVLALPREKPLFVFPAMDTDMWLHPATQKNCTIIESYGGVIIPPESGELASGIIGVGRLPEPATIVEKIENFFSQQQKRNGLLTGKKVLITAGPTYERFDAVRFIGNYSSGKMGFALAESAFAAGADVTLITGPVSLQSTKGITRVDVESAQEMFEKVRHFFPESDIGIFSAAVADFTPNKVIHSKMKKESIGEELSITLSKTNDILGWAGSQKEKQQYIVGFALETDNEIEQGRAKLIKKNCDLMVINKANTKDSGFGGDNNTITILNKIGEVDVFPPLSKMECADIIIKKVIRDI